MKTNADVIALQRVIRDLQRERKRIWAIHDDPDIDSKELMRGAVNGVSNCIRIIRDRIKRLRKRAAKGAGT